MESFDLIVIGTGGGLKVALPAAARGLRTAVIEEDRCGGTCLNRGCIPSKMLIYPADLLGLVERAGRVNLRVPVPPAVDFSALVGRIQETIRGMAEDIERQLRSTPHLTFIPGRARFVDDRTVAVGGVTMTAPRIVIGVGSRPLIPAIEGLSGTPYMTSTDALTRRDLPRRLVVLGAGYIACELGHAYRAFGAETHFIVRSRFLRHEDDELQQLFQRAFSQAHTVHRGVPVRVAHAGGEFSIEVEQADGTTATVQADALLVAAGVRPNTDSLDLDRTAIRVRKSGMIEVDDSLRTSVEGVYALGDCAGRYLLRHSVNREGEYLVRTVLDGQEEGPLDYGPMPHAVFTDPEVASAGASERVLLERGIDYVAGRATYAESNMGLARQSRTGFVKILAERPSGRLLGAHVLGEEASTLIQSLVAMMYHRHSVRDLLDVVYIHPALPELVRDAAREAWAALQGGASNRD